MRKNLTRWDRSPAPKRLPLYNRLNFARHFFTHRKGFALVSSGVKIPCQPWALALYNWRAAYSEASLQRSCLLRDAFCHIIACDTSTLTLKAYHSERHCSPRNENFVIIYPYVDPNLHAVIFFQWIANKEFLRNIYVAVFYSKTFNSDHKLQKVKEKMWF